MLRSIYFFIFSLLQFTSLLAQNGLNFDQQNEQIYESLDDSAIPFDLLFDKGSTNLDLSYFDGDLSKDSVKVSKIIGECLYNSVHTANTTDTLPLPLLAELNKNLDTLQDFDIIPFVMAFQKMAVVKQNALNMQLLQFENGRLLNGPNNLESPYELTQLFFQYPVVSKYYTYTPRFKLTDSLFFNNSGEWNDLEMDFDDGLGFRDVSMDEEFMIYYQLIGEKVIKTRFTDDSNITYLAQSKIKIMDPSSRGTARWGIQPDDLITELDFPELEGLQLSVWYNDQCQNSPNQIRKPLIFIEGFDATGCTGPDEFWDEIDDKYELPGGNNFLRQDLLDNGYDLIFINLAKTVEQTILVGNPFDPFSEPELVVKEFTFNKGTDDISVNSDRIINAIKWINSQKSASGSVEENVVLGASMGGILGKLSHLKMESELYEHQTKTFITFDSPLRGANIPLGFQAMVKRLAKTEVFGKELGNYVPQLGDGYKGLSSPAARNQAFYHIDGYDKGDATLYHTDFYKVFNHYPELKVEHIAISNSAEDDTGMLYGNGELILDQDETLSLGAWYADFALYALTGSKFKIKQKIWAAPGQSSNSRVYEGNIKFKKRILFFGTLWTWFTVEQSPVNYNSNWMNLDASVGGMRPFNQVESCRDANDGEGFDIPVLQNAFCFVPKFSGFDIDPNNSSNTGASSTHANTLQNFRWRDSNDVEIHPNDPDQKNEKHVHFTNRNIQYMVYSFLDENEIIYNSGGLDGRIYNFGKGEIEDWDQVDHSNGVVRRSTTHLIDEDMILEEGAELWINGDGPIGWLYEEGQVHSEESDKFVVDIASVCDNKRVLVHIRADSWVKVGEPNQSEIGKLRVNDNATIVVGNKGRLKVNDNSELIIREGGQVIVYDGGSLQARNGKIIVESGGKLKIETGGRLLSSWGGEIVIKEGGSLIIDGSLIELQGTNGLLSIYGKMHIRESFDFKGYGLIKFHSTHQLVIDKLWDFKGAGKFYKNIELAENTTINISEADLVLQNTTVAYGYNTSIKQNGGKHLSQGVNFEGNGSSNSKALELNNLDQIKIIISDFSGFYKGIKIDSYETNQPVSIQASNFNESVIGIQIEESTTVVIGHCKFNSVESPIDATDSGLIHLTSSTLNGDISSYGIVLSDVNAFHSNASEINGYAVGIYCPDGKKANVFLNKKTVLENNVIGVEIQRGGNSGNEVHGLVLADCAKFINNGVAIKGIDLELKIDAFENCNGCDPKDVAPNHFIGETIIQLTLDQNDNSQLNASGNYWGPNGYDPSVVNITTSNPFTGVFSAPESNGDQGCRGFNGPQTPNFPTSTEACEIKTSGKEGNTAYQQFHRGYSYFRNERYIDALPYFQSVSNIETPTRNNSDFICRHYVDVSRAIVKGYESNGFTYLNIDDKKGFNSSDSTRKQERETKLIQRLSVYPNPVASELSIENLSEDWGTLRIYELTGKEIFNSQIQQNLKVDVEDWIPGIYFLKLTDDNGTSIGESKLIVK